MASQDYIPRKEGDLTPWTENFITVATANLVTLDLEAADITALTTKKTAYSTSLNTSIAKQLEAKAATEDKNLKKNELKSNIRLLARQIQANPDVSGSLKEQLGLRVADPIPTPTDPIPPTDTTIEISSYNLWRVKWNRNGNPQGTVFIIETTGFAEGPWVFDGTSTKTSYETSHHNVGGPTFFRVRAQRGEDVSEPGNVVAV